MLKEDDLANNAHYLQKVVDLIHIAHLSSENKHHLSKGNPSLKSCKNHRGKIDMLLAVTNLLTAFACHKGFKSTLQLLKGILKE